MTAFRIEVSLENIERVPQADWREFCLRFEGQAPGAKISYSSVRDVQIVEGTLIDPLIVSVVAAVAMGHPIRMILDHITAELAK